VQEAEQWRSSYFGTALPRGSLCWTWQFGRLGTGRAHQDPFVSFSPFFRRRGHQLTSFFITHRFYAIGLQTQTGSGPTARYHGPVDALRKIHRTDGIRGVYHGQVTTLAREIHGYGVYFAAYEALVARELRQKGITRKDLPVSSAIMYGAASGYAMWLT